LAAAIRASDAVAIDGVTQASPATGAQAGPHDIPAYPLRRQ
jgi:hypothetical protein